jgi:adenine-specific DNA-methyltransferase
MDKRQNTVKARLLRKAMTDAERALWRLLRAREFAGLKFRRQHPLGSYVTDFVCLSAKLVIEADGGHHAEQVDGDSERTRYLEAMGFRVVRFWNNEILTMQDAVRARIWLAVHENHPHPALSRQRERGTSFENNES